jgi:2-phospho-L-lactate/phosphoenolpyruvate guanylyltransferase
VTPPLAALAVKPFGAAKQRLSRVLTPSQRHRLGRGLAERTLEIIEDAGLEPVVLAADAEVESWAMARSTAVLTDPGDGLNGAAGGAAARATRLGRPWLICHADLPLLTAAELRGPAAVVASGGFVLAPSSDGGTSLLGGAGAFAFAYGPASFHRHLARVARHEPTIVTGLGLWLDLDSPADLTAALRHPRGSRLRAILSDR